MIFVSCSRTLFHPLHQLDGRRLLSIHAGTDRANRLRIILTASTPEIAKPDAGRVGMGCHLHVLRDLQARGMRTRGPSHSPRRPGLYSACLLRPRSPPSLASA